MMPTTHKMLENDKHELRAEIERLQETLKSVVSMQIFVADGEHGFERAFLRCQEIARRALEGR